MHPTDPARLWRPKGRPDYERQSATLKRFVSRLAEPCEHRADHLPRITIITPSFNQAEFLERTIVSVLNQGYANLEYLVIDGGSTDGSIEILRRYAPHLSYWVSEPDGGQAHAINKGLRMATGEWVGFQNSDDLYLPGGLAHLAGVIQAHPEAELVYGDFLHIDAEDQVVEAQPTMPAHLWLQLAHGPQIHNPSALWRRSLLERCGYLREDMVFCFDYEFFTRLLSHGAKPRHGGGYVGAFRRHATAKSSTILDVAAAEDRLIRQAYAGKLGRLFSRPLSRRISGAYRWSWLMLNGKAWYPLRHLGQAKATL